MAVSTLQQLDIEKQERDLYKELDKGIEDMENGRLIPHEEAIQILRERLRSHGI